jgi:hypothetical protein
VERFLKVWRPQSATGNAFGKELHSERGEAYVFEISPMLVNFQQLQRKGRAGALVRACWPFSKV